ncbi:MAG: sugar porter family MFS transporter [Victivallales bacterium]|nr:sugar porter family MFS transporter [Victivallales bacterium]
MKDSEATIEKNYVIKDKNTGLITFFVIIISALAGCLYGLDIGAISGALGFITKEMHLSAGQQGMIVGAVLGGGSIAILITGILADIFGRKKMIVLSAIIFIVGVFMTSYSTDYNTLLYGRLVMGTGVGISAILIPLYLSETAPAKIRGRAISCYQLFLTGGILLAYVIDMAFTKSGNWRGMFESLAVPGLLFAIGTFFLPESPTWCFTKNQIDRSKNILRKFHNETNMELIMASMVALKKENAEEENKTIFKKAYVIPFLIAFSIACLTQMTGVNCILQYAPTIFEKAGSQSKLITMILGTGVTLINFLITILALTLIDKVGRKPLLVLSTAGSAISLIVLGIAASMAVSDFKTVLLTLGMFGFIFAYGVGIGVIVWLAMSELLPTAIRSKGLAICLFANSMVSTVLAAVFMTLEKSIGFSGIFFLLAGFTVVYFIIAVFFLPETKGKTIEQIEEYFRKK